MLLKLKRSDRSFFEACSAYLQEHVKTIDWNLLAFLLLFLNVKMIVKVIAIILIYLARPDFHFGFKLKNSRLPFFYIIVIGIATFNWLINGLFLNTKYDILFLTGISFWGLCILAAHQIKLAVEKNDVAVIHQTIVVFFISNIIISLLTYATIIWKTGTINPFQYQGGFQQYYIGTGDYIKGVTMDTSTTNAVISAFGVFYFLAKKNALLCLLCMSVLLLTGSNFTNILLCLVLAYTFIFQSGREQKSLVIICIMLMVIFMVKVSPQNEKYISEWYNNNFKKQIVKQPIKNSNVIEARKNILSGEEIKQQIARKYLDSIDRIERINKQYKIIGNISPALVSQITGKPEMPKPDINSAPFQYKQDTTATQKELIKYIAVNNLVVTSKVSLTQPKYPGKFIAALQTINYLKKHPAKILTGTGIGNFSSKLAFRGTAMKIAGGYPAECAYINDDFKNNHFDLYLYYFSKLDNLHSLTNSPNSTYDSLLAEYGIAGFIAFFIFYAGYFLKHRKQLTYGIPVLLIMTGAFFIEYWFEQLSVVVVFELLLLLNIKETQIKHSSVK